MVFRLRKQVLAAAFVAMVLARPARAEDFDIESAHVVAMPPAPTLQPTAVAAPVQAGTGDLGFGMYVQAFAGVRFASRQDSQSYFQFGGGALPGAASQVELDPDGGVAVGVQLGGTFGIEAGVDDERLDMASTTAQGSWNCLDVYAMPELRFALPGAAGPHRRMQVFGLRIGEASLAGSSGPLVHALPGYPGPPLLLDGGSGDETAQGVDLGLAYRLEAMQGKAFDLGVELAYDYLYFPELAAHPGIVTAASGAPLRLNASGFTVRLVLGEWLLGTPPGR